MPTLAMEAKQLTDEIIKVNHINESDEQYEHDVVEEFISYLDNAIYDARDMLIERFEYICSQDASSAKFMYENGTMAGYIPEEGIRSALKHGTLALG